MALIGPSLALLVAACQGGGNDDGDGGTSRDGGTDAEPEEPHALATLTIGEWHPAEGGSSSASVSVSFLPDAALAAVCQREIAGCTVPVQADCGDSCGDDQYCVLDDDCQSVCKDICDKICEDDEVCYFPSPNSPACRKREDFDGGAISLTGTTVPVNLYPPYGFDGSDTGSLFVSGAELGVVATGATSAGFAAFEKEFTATTLLQTSPPLDELTVAELFGDGDIPIGWRAENDEIWITATLRGAEGAATALVCKAEDAAGSFDIPRQAIEEALGEEALDTISIEVARVRREVFEDLETVGSLSATEMQDEGWLDVSTRSAESAYFEGCSGSELFCSGECVSLSSDPDNCGTCGNDCGTDGCSQGTCAGPIACDQCTADSIAPGGLCKAAYDACEADSECVALGACLEDCTDQTCVQECSNDHSTAIDLYNDKIYCWCDNACPIECGPLCN